MAYASQSGMEAIFGVPNILKWGDADKDGSLEAARIAAAVAYADNYIEDFLRMSQYIVPLEQPGSSTAPITISDMANRLGGVWLYTTLGIEHYSFESGKMTHALSGVKKEVDDQLKDIADGRVRLDAK